MRRPPPYASGISYSFGPGPLTPAVKALVIANVAAFLLTSVLPGIVSLLGLTPVDVLTRFWVWQPVTYMFLHGGLFHLLFNMLALWMFGVELERAWGTEAFLKYYFITGIGAGLTMLGVSLLPFEFARLTYYSITVGASGAIYGLLLAYALRFPNRPIYMYMVFPIPAKYFVMIIGAISFFLSVGGSGGGVAHAAHLGGLVVGYLYLKGGGTGLTGEVKYRYLKWKMNRMRRKFDVHTGGGSGSGRGTSWDKRIH